MRSFLYIFISLNIPTPYSPHFHPISRIPTQIPNIPRIPHIPTPIPCIPTLIPRIPTLIPCIPIQSEIAMYLCDNHWKSGKFSVLYFEIIFSKTKTFFKKLEYRFLVEIKNKHFHAKLLCQKSKVQNGPITENGVLLVTTLFF